MENLINVQLAQRELLEKSITNYKKDGKERRTKTYYEKQLQNLEELWTDFKNRHREILVMKYSDKTFDPKKSENFTKEIFEQMDEFFIVNYASIKERFEKEYPEESPEKSNQGQFEKTIIREHSVSSLKLPKIYLEKFNGDYTKWPTFRDLFRTMVHENMSLSPVQKLQYLKLHLIGEPEQLLRHFQVTDDKYAAAWNLLKDRYDNKRILVNTQLKILLSQPTLTVESAQGVKALLDITTECLQALNNLDVDTSNWDPLIVYFIVQRLPSETHQLWEQAVNIKRDLPTWKSLQAFLETRFRTLEAVSAKRVVTNKSQNFQHNRAKSNPKSFHVSTNVSCLICLNNHNIRQCPTFLSYNSLKRMEVVKSKGLCINCLGSGHILTNCPSQLKCWHCKRRHHSLLHRNPKEIEENIVTNNNHNNNQNVSTNYGSCTENVNSPRYQNSSVPPSTSSQALCATAPTFNPNQDISTTQNLSSFVISKAPSEQVLLATAMVRIVSPSGREQVVRALIDQGSQASFLTETVAQDLKLKRESINVNVEGLGKEHVNHINHRVHFEIKPIRSDYAIQISGLVLKKLTDFLPTKTVAYKQWPHIQQLDLADPQFHQPGKIDLLLGADIYGQILMNGIIKSINGSPIAQKTQLGWILSGEIGSQEKSSLSIQNFHITTSLDDQLKRFWELEEIHDVNMLTDEEVKCEQIFEKTTKRLPDGRYEVQLPFRDESETCYLGQSRNIAVSRLFQMENRFRKDPNFQEEYVNVLNEYLALGHMEKVSISEDKHSKFERGRNSYSCSYLPHHGVVKESSTTTKLRVVFDASRATKSGISLNDMLLKGPIIQDEIATLLIRWRKHRIAFGADLEKMYRQVRVASPHTDVVYAKLKFLQA